jgi:hypothetical protein
MYTHPFITLIEEEQNVTKAVIVSTDLVHSREAGNALGVQISEAMQGPPDVVILFASPDFEHTTLLQALKETCHPELIVGCSSAGEFTSTIQGEGLACAVALRSSDIRFAAGVGHGPGTKCENAAKEVVASFQGISNHSYRYHSALVLTDALAGLTDTLVESLTVLTAGSYQFFGGGAGDNAQFQSTPVFYNTEVLSDAVVVLEILSNKPVGIGVRHGWQPASPSLRVTEVNGMNLVSLNAMPAVEAFQEHALRTGQLFNSSVPLPFFLHNILGIDTGPGHKLRVPLSVNPDGSILCAAEIPVGAKVQFMRTSSASAAEAAASSVEAALNQLNGCKPAVALFFDCVATRLRMGKEFGFELEALQHALGQAQYVGCNSHGQIARAEGQFSGFHNCTAVVCLIPE